MKTLLAAVDFSETTPCVLRAAASLCDAVSGRLWVIHVAPPEPAFIGYEPGPQVVRDQVAASIREEHRRLDEVVAELKADGLDARALLVQGSMAEKILEKADDVSADAIVIGSHGHGALFDLLVGSVTDGVLRGATCPVLVVPAPRDAG
jgi:nucleotide-binding universal stress UspA family protein